MKQKVMLWHKMLGNAALWLLCGAVLSACGDVFTVTANAGAGGSISPGSRIVTSGKVISFKVTADPSFGIGSVTGCNGSLNGNTYTTGPIIAACRVQASFNRNSYAVTATAGEGGSISPGTLAIAHGAIAEFTVAAENGYTLATISGCNGSLTDNTYRTAPITSVCSVAATFAKQVIAGELPENVGSMTAAIKNTNEVYFHADTKGFIPVTGHAASPAQAPPAGWSFTYGLFDFTAVQRVAGGSAVITLSYPVALPDGFSYYKFGSSTAGAAPGWYVLPASHYEVSADRKTLTLTIFDGQLGDSDGVINGIIKDPGGPAVQQQYTVTASAGEGGGVSPGSAVVNDGGSTSFSVTPQTGYSIASVTGCNGSLSGNTYTTGAISGACSVQASFSLNSYTVSATAGEGGSISPGSATVQHGATTAFAVTVNEGYSLSAVTGCNGSLSGNTYTTGAISGACSVQASFSQNSYMVTAIATAGGQITPGSLSVLHGQTAQFSVVADDNHRIVEVTGCGGSLAGETYTTGAITAACTLDASFAFVPIGGLNDTGIDWCANNNTNNLGCPVAGFEEQDGEYGRDAKARAATLTKIGGGAAGFDYSKIAADGSVLPIQDVAWDANGTEAAGSQWSCVRDNVTGLIWEVKTTDGGLRDMNHTYTWYNPDSSSNGGAAGTQSGGSCTGSGCDTHAFVQAVNSQGLCGANDWRMPTRKELLSIVHNGRINPAIDTAYFPNSISGWSWSSSPNAFNSNYTLIILFGNGYVDGGGLKSSGYWVRLVRAGQ